MQRSVSLAAGAGHCTAHYAGAGGDRAAAARRPGPGLLQPPPLHRHNQPHQPAGRPSPLLQTGCLVANLGLYVSSQLFGAELAEPGAGPRPGCQLHCRAIPGGLSPSRLSSHHLRLGPHLGRPLPLPASRQDKPRPGAIQVEANQLADQTNNNQNCDCPPGCRTRSTSTPYRLGTCWAAWCSGSTRRTTGWRSSWVASGTRTLSTSEQHFISFISLPSFFNFRFKYYRSNFFLLHKVRLVGGQPFAIETV